jgi:hypothetical protein
MTSGYGRGYYGAGQLAPQPPRRGSSWIKLVAVMGVGAAVWFMWPRKPKQDYDPSGGGGGGGGDPRPPAPLPLQPLPEGQPLEPLSEGHPSQAPQSHGYPGAAAQFRGYPGESLDQAAQSRGYPSQQAYEDAVVASARQLQEAGAKVSFAPHFQHLTPRLGP